MFIESKSGNSSIIQTDEAIRNYRSHLTGIYDTRHLPVDDKYPLQCVKHFVNLECADVSKHLLRKEIEESWSEIVQGKLDRFPRKTITMGQIASKIEDKFSKLVVIKGAPGGGKTTLSWELCKRWANGEVWTNYSLVVLLRLRDENVQESVELVDLFQYEDTQVSRCIDSIIRKNHGQGILFILEGLDELPLSLREKNSIFMKLITGRLLSSCTVLVTTRPWALCDLPVTCSSRVDQLIEILGFSSEEIQEYIDLMIRDGAPPELREYINSNPHITSAMYNPLYARILVEVYRECHDKNNSIFPNTTTELYTAYSQILIGRYLHENPACDWSGELNKLPSSLQVHFDKLCQIAYNGITKEKQQLVFFKEDVVDAASTTLGFMNSVHPLYKSTMKRNSSPSYNFLHLTLQEFLSAIHIWRTFSQQKQLLFIETQSGKYSMIILFLVGLTRLSDSWTKCVLPAPRVRSSDNRMVVYLDREHILWLYEIQNEQLISSFDNVVLSIELTQSQLDPLYFLALGYCIAVGKFMLELKFDKRIETLNPHLMAGLERQNFNCSSQIKVLDILSTWGTLPLPDSLYEIINYIPAATQGVLHVRNGDQTPIIWDGKYLPLASKLSKFLENVEMVTIPSTKLRDSLEVLRYSRTLKILHCRIDNSEIPDILNDSITELCSSLEYLEVIIDVHRADGSNAVESDLYDIDSESAYSVTYLIFGLNIKKFKELNLCQLFSLNFGSIRTGDFTQQVKEYIDHFSVFLKNFRLFTNGNPLRSSSLKQSIYHSLSTCPILEKLSIDVDSDIFDSHQNIIAFAPRQGKRTTLQNLYVQSNNVIKALRENSSVRQLYCNTGFTSDDTVDEFCSMLRHNSVLEEICIQVCDVTAGDVRMTVLSLKKLLDAVCNLTLKKFMIRLRFFAFKPVDLIANNDTITAICHLLEYNKFLEYLDLPTLCMEPNQRFLLPIANALSENSSLTTLILKFKPAKTEFSKPDYKFTLEDTKAVGDMLKVNKTLCALHLMVDIPDWSPIIEGLKLNTTITELHIPSSARQSAIKCSDYDSVRSRIKYPVK